MGLRGPAKKPTALRLIEGNRGKEKINRAEPKPRKRIPDCPPHLDKIARAEWERLSPILLHMGVLSEADYMSLAALCQSYSIWVQASGDLARDGLLAMGARGVVKNPSLMIVRDAVQDIHRLSQQFGLTPASRVNIHSDGPQTPEDELEDALSRPS